MNPRERILKVLLYILNNPGRYTRREIAEHFGVAPDIIDKDTQVINQLPELTLHYQEYPHRCYIEPNNKYNALEVFRPLSEEDRYYVMRALDNLGNAKLARTLKTKIEGLYDFQQLGLRQLRHPAIARINGLEEARQQQQRVILVRYRSNSNRIKDREVEPFHIDPELDTLQAYDVDRDETRHFRLSRIERVKVLDKPWSKQGKHEIRYTDVFRIANNDQRMVKLRLSVQAYNVLLEAYPMSHAYVEADADENAFLFQAKVNADYLGLLNFLMGYMNDVEIIAPDDLKTAVKTEAEKILKKLSL